MGSKMEIEVKEIKRIYDQIHELEQDKGRIMRRAEKAELQIYRLRIEIAALQNTIQAYEKIVEGHCNFCEHHQKKQQGCEHGAPVKHNGEITTYSCPEFTVHPSLWNGESRR